MSVHAFHPNDPALITSCTFDNVDIKSLSPEKIFPLGSKWKDRSLLHSTVHSYAALTGWKPAVSHTHTIKCSCYNRRLRGSKERKFKTGSLSKGCKWQITIKSTINKSISVKKGKNAGKFASVPVVDDGVPVIISKCILEHTGTCNPSTLQQIMQRSRCGAYIKSISDTAFFTICSMYKANGNVSNTVIREILKSQFPANVNVTNRHVWSMKQRVKLILPKIKHCDNFHDFQHTLKSTKLPSGIDNIPFNDDTKKYISHSTVDDSLSDSSCNRNFDPDNGDEFISDQKVAADTECSLTQTNASHCEQLQQEQSTELFTST